MDDARFDAIAARERLAAHGWISRRTESFRHLTPPDVAVWIGEGQPQGQEHEHEREREIGTGWSMHVAGARDPQVVVARTLDAREPAQRAQLLAGVPAPDEDDAAPFAWAHRALVREGLRLRIAAAADDAVPCVELRLDARAQVTAPLLVVEVLPGARCVLVEAHDRSAEGGRFGGTRGVVQNLQVRVLLGSGASLVHLRTARPRSGDRIAHDLQVHVDGDARYAGALLATGSHYHLQRATIGLRGERAAGSIGSVLLAQGAALDQQVRAQHAAAATRSVIETLGLAGDAARLVVNGHTRIAAGCGGADARQRLTAIPTRGNPRVTLRPHLVIEHDDVQAAHGATFGALPEDALFHARQRGLDERTAQALIVGGLARATLSRALPDPGVLASHEIDSLLDAAVGAHLAASDRAPEPSHG
jgi:Fe-S cluster assembly protein SufD